ncbi:MAG: SCO family protein [Limisphaerales bacterium]
MKTRTIIMTFVALTLAVVVSAVAIHRQIPAHNPATHQAAEQSFDVKGRIVSLEPGGKTVHIAHEDIPDFMPAMTMPFTIKHPEQVADLAPGDAVKFHLIVTKDDSFVSAIDKIAGTTRPVTKAADESNSDRVETGQAVPNFQLVDQNGAPLKLSDYRGSAVLVTFIYTRCPLPNFCPLMSNRFLDLQDRLAKKVPGKVHLISVSFDPEFDTPSVMKEYGKRFGVRQKTWSLATGSQKQVDYVAGLFGLIKEKDANGYTHDLRTALISPDGKLVHIWRSNVWTTEEVESRISEVLGNS